MTARVLVLDDEPEIGKLIVRVARKLGMDARAMTSAAEFMDEVAEWAPTLLVIDLLVPEQDGVELLRKLAKRSEPPPIVLISGVAGRVLEAARQVAVARGLDVLDVINKPFSAAAMKEVLTGSLTVTKVEGQSEHPPPPTPSMEYDDLKRAIDNQEIGVALLPKVDCKSHRVIGFEALARWHREDGVQVSTEEFIACIEKHGLIRPLSDIVFDAAMQWLGKLDPVDRPALCLNLSPLLLREHDFAESLAKSAKHYGIDTGDIVLELAEHSFLNESSQMFSAITALRLRGFHIAIEDVGSRYGALASLAELPLSEMKIDKTFVKGIARNGESRMIIESMVMLGHDIGLKVIAEGVEDAEADRFLVEAGCDMAQGYFYSAPMAPGAASEWLAQHQVRS